MRIYFNTINSNILGKRNNCRSLLRLNVLKHDTVSFSGAKRDLNKDLFDLPEEAFPSLKLRKFLISAVSNPDNHEDLPELHKKYYSELLNCETLEEAKKIYPEFNDVVDAEDIDLSKQHPKSVFIKINSGVAEGINLSNLSLELLKMHYAKLKSNKEIAAVFGFGGSGFTNMMKKLNIKTDTRYIKLLEAFKHSKVSQRLWADPNHRTSVTEKISQSALEQWKRPEYRATISAHSKERWTDELKQQQSEIMTARNVEFRENPKYAHVIPTMHQKQKEAWNSEKLRKEQSERMKKYRESHPEYVEQLQIVYKANKEAYKRHPEILEVQKRVAQEFGPKLWKIFEKNKKGLPLTENEVKLLNLYYKKCDEECPNYQKIIGQTQKEILEEWGFYKK